MEYTEEMIKKIVQSGTLGYPLSKIINVLDITDGENFTKDFDNPDSIVAKSYQKGIDKSDFLIDSKLFEMAKDGDLKAMVKYEERKSEQLYLAEKEKQGR